MAGVTSEHRFTGVSVDQLRSELTAQSLAGFGGSMIEFKSASNGSWSTAVTMKMFKPLDEPKGKHA